MVVFKWQCFLSVLPDKESKAHFLTNFGLVPREFTGNGAGIEIVHHFTSLVLRRPFTPTWPENEANKVAPRPSGASETERLSRCCLKEYG